MLEKFYLTSMFVGPPTPQVFLAAPPLPFQWLSFLSERGTKLHVEVCETVPVLGPQPDSLVLTALYLTLQLQVLHVLKPVSLTSLSSQLLGHSLEVSSDSEFYSNPLDLVRFPCSGFPWWLSKESACNAGDLGSTPGSGRSPGEGNGYPLQYSCLGRGAWRATVHGVAKSQTRLSDYHFHFHTFPVVLFISFKYMLFDSTK